MSPEADPSNYDSMLRYRAEFSKDSPPNLNGAYWVTAEHSELSTDEVNERSDDAD
jgi:hypothetical protein